MVAKIRAANLLAGDVVVFVVVKKLNLCATPEGLAIFVLNVSFDAFGTYIAAVSVAGFILSVGF